MHDFRKIVSCDDIIAIRTLRQVKKTFSYIQILKIFGVVDKNIRSCGCDTHNRSWVAVIQSITKLM